MTHSPDGAKEELLRLELQLMDPAFRKDRIAVSKLLAEDFREFGSSGRVWSRETILDLLAEESGWTAPAVEDFVIRPITRDAILVTYRTIHADPPRASLRSSVWVREHAGWQMLFHQGTRTPDPESD